MRLGWVLGLMLAMASGLFGDEAFACSCAPTEEPCEAYWNASAVFTGTVVEVTNTTIPITWGDETIDYPQRLVRLNVLEAFRNTDAGSIEVLTGMGDTDCGYGFVVGESYLVYGFSVRSDARLRAHICSRTRRVEDASADLEYIRSLSSADTPGRVFGVASLYNSAPDGDSAVYVGPLASIRFTLTNEERQLAAKTDSSGHFEFAHVPPGTYVLRGPASQESGDPFVAKNVVVVQNGACKRSDVRALVGGQRLIALDRSRRQR